MKPPAHFTFRPGTWDREIWEAVVTRNEYQLPKKFETGDIVIDVGAHIGSFSWACLNRGAWVMGYEACHANWKQLNAHLGNASGMMAAAHGAVWRSDRIESYLSVHPPELRANTGGHQVIGHRQRTGVAETRWMVRAVALDSILSCLGKVRIVKLACEGSEFPILFTSKRLDQVQEICGEYHEIDVPPPLAAVDGFWTHTGVILKAFLMCRGFDVGITPDVGTRPTNENRGLFWARRPAGWEWKEKAA